MQPIDLFMKTISKYLSAVGVAVVLAMPCANAQKNLADTLQKLSQGRIVVHEPAGLQSRIESDTVVAARSSSGTRLVHKAGYRIQVYSDNHPRNAKSKASAIAARVSAAFPNLRTYTIYKAPYWRLKVGDFVDHDEAVEAMRDLKKAFPAYAGDMIVIRDRVTIIE